LQSDENYRLLLYIQVDVNSQSEDSDERPTTGDW
jgi:hypothetical protein